jgi:hypothetical protein
VPPAAGREIALAEKRAQFLQVRRDERLAALPGTSVNWVEMIQVPPFSRSASATGRIRAGRAAMSAISGCRVHRRRRVQEVVLQIDGQQPVRAGSM